MTPDSSTKIKQHVAHSRQYLDNGLIALKNNEAGKAGELLWGCVSQAVHALAEPRNVPINTHRDLKNFAIQVSEETNDESLLDDFNLDDFNLTEGLHGNFYVVRQEPRDIELVLPPVRRAVAKLIDLIPSEGLEGIPDI